MITRRIYEGYVLNLDNIWTHFLASTTFTLIIYIITKRIDFNKKTRACHDAKHTFSDVVLSY